MRTSARAGSLSFTQIAMSSASAIEVGIVPPRRRGCCAGPARRWDRRQQRVVREPTNRDGRTTVPVEKKLSISVATAG